MLIGVYLFQNSFVINTGKRIMPKPKQPELDIPPKFKRQSLLSDEKFIWVGGPQVTRFGYWKLEWKYRDLTFLFIALGIASFVSTYLLIHEQVNVLIPSIIIFSLFLIRFYLWKLFWIALANTLTDSLNVKLYAITQYHIFYQSPGTDDMVRVPFRKIKNYEVTSNTDGTVTVKFYANRHFYFDHVQNSAKLSVLLDRLIEKNHKIVSKPFRNQKTKT